MKKIINYIESSFQDFFYSFERLKSVIIFLSVFPLSFLLVRFLNSSEIFNFFLYNVADNIESYLHAYLWSILILEFVFVIMIIKNNYRFSYWQHYFILSISIIYFILDSNQKNWCFIKIGNTISYASLMVFLLIGIVIIQLIRRIYFNIKNIFEKQTLNYFIEDKPFISAVENKILSKIKPIIFLDKYETSFTIGLIGPWGTGKSSIMESVQKQIDVEKNKNIFQFSFSPFLNHNEDQIITDFFTQLSNVLKIKDGSLSNLLLNYAGKLTNVFKDKNALSWFKPAPSSSEQETAGELYAKIKNIINKLDIKLIIYIDDLDRLTAKEIYNVLKLIRNTSNFPNTVFIVALDKEFSKKSIKEHLKLETDTYLDKFFQLEIFIPFPESDKLLTQFSLLKKQFVALNQNSNDKIPKLLDDIEVELKNSILDLKGYITNYRDVVFLMNTIISDIDFLLNYHEDIILNEYLCLCILKKNYPEIYNILGVSHDMILEVPELIASDNYGAEELIYIDDLHNDTLDSGGNLTLINFDNLKEKFEKIDNQAYSILILLFTKNNKPQSIKFYENFQLLIHHYPRRELFSTKDLAQLIEKPSDNDQKKIKEIINSEQYLSFIRKLEKFEPISKDHLFNFGVFIIKLLINTNIRLYKIIYSHFSITSKYFTKFNLQESDLFNYYDSLFSNFKIDYSLKKDLIISEHTTQDKDKLGLNENYLFELSKYLIRQYFFYPEPFSIQEKINLVFDVAISIKSKKHELLKFALDNFNDEINKFISAIIVSDTDFAYSIDKRFFNLFLLDEKDFIALNNNLQQFKFLSKTKFLEFTQVLYINGNFPILNFPFTYEGKKNQITSFKTSKQFLCKFKSEKEDFSILFERTSILNVDYIRFNKLNKIQYLFVKIHLTDDYSGLYNILNHINSRLAKIFDKKPILNFDLENERFEILLDGETVFEVIQSFE
jgi:hypothetical protein